MPGLRQVSGKKWVPSYFPKRGPSSTFCQSLSMVFIQSVRDAGTKTTWWFVEYFSPKRTE